MASSISTNYLKKYWNETPAAVRSFLLKALVCFLIWKIAYHVYIKPHRLLDVPLTTQTATNTQKSLSLLYPQKNFSNSLVSTTDNSDFFGISIFANGKKVITILDPCNALELYILYVLFIICLPSNWKRMVLFSVLGIICIYLLNILRCTVLGMLNINKSLYVDFAHHYLFTMVVYIAIFAGWALYINKSMSNETE
jgi:exosortase family protein XrtF